MLKRMVVMLGINMVMALIMPGSVLAQDWYVDGTNGDDNYSAWRVHDGHDYAYRTIGQAVRNAAVGDVIKVAAGTYAEYVAIDKAVSIIGEPGAIIEGRQREQCGIAIQGVNGVALTGLTFANCSYGIYVNSSAATISNCVFKDNASAVFVYDPADKPVSVTGSAFIRNDNAIHSYYHSSNVAVSNCDFVDNGTALYRQWSDNDYRVQQSIFAENNRTFWYSDPQSGSVFDPPTVTQSNFYANSDAYTPVTTTSRARAFTSTQNLAVDPQFADKDNDNLFLLATSPMLLTDARQQTVLIGAYGIAEQPAVEEEQAVADEPIQVPSPALPIVVASLPLEPVAPVQMPQRPVSLTLTTIPQEDAAPVPTEAQPVGSVTAAEPVPDVPAIAVPSEEPAVPATEPAVPVVIAEPTQEQTPATDTIVPEPVEEIIEAITAVIDTIAPESILQTDLPAGALRAVPETKLTLTATDNAAHDGSNSGVARIEYRVNGGGWTAYAASVEFHKLMDGTTRGNLIIGYRAIDRQGNIETEKTASFEVQPALNVSACLLATPRVLCWWNNEAPGSNGRGNGRDNSAVRGILTGILDSAALDYRIVEDRGEFVAGLNDFNVYLVIGDREKLRPAEATKLIEEVAAGKSIISLGYAGLPTPERDDRRWENIFGVKVKGTLEGGALLALPANGISDTTSIGIAGTYSHIREVQAGEVLGEIALIDQRRNGHGVFSEASDYLDESLFGDEGGNKLRHRRGDTYPAIVSGNWEQGKTLYCCVDAGSDLAGLANTLRRAIAWVEPAGITAGPGEAVAVGITVTNAVLPMQLQVNVEGHPGDGCEVLKVFDGGERRAGYAVWFDDLQPGVDGTYRLILRRQGAVACRISVDAYYLDGRSFRLSEMGMLNIQ